MTKRFVMSTVTSALVAAGALHTRPAAAQFYACVQFTNDTQKNLSLDVTALEGVWASTSDCPSTFGANPPSGTIFPGQTVIFATQDNNGFLQTSPTSGSVNVDTTVTTNQGTTTQSVGNFDFDSPWGMWHGLSGNCNSNTGGVVSGGPAGAGDNTCSFSFGATMPASALNKVAGGVLAGDYNGDRAADIAMWRPSNGTWYVINSDAGSGRPTATQWGQSGDVTAMADYDHNGKADLAVWRPSEGNWYIEFNPIYAGGAGSIQWGISGDRPVPGDYDGDGVTDFAVWRPSEGNWYVKFANGSGTTKVSWGVNLDVPVPGDYDGDGKTDYAVWRPSNGTWYIIKSTGGTTTQQWGQSGDAPVPADYDGDGKIDPAVWRPSNKNWYILYSTGGARTKGWGISGDVPPIDYQGYYAALLGF